jgi:hypothetical protein
MDSDSKYFEKVLKHLSEQDPELNSLTFGDNVMSLTHEQCQILVKALQSNKIVKDLYIYQDDLTDSSFQGISKTKITALLIPQCPVSSQLINELINMPQLLCLDISSAKLDHEENDFVKLLDNLANLQVFRIATYDFGLNLQARYPRTKIINYHEFSSIK